jgi:hypothetical protein
LANLSGRKGKKQTQIKNTGIHPEIFWNLNGIHVFCSMLNLAKTYFYQYS